jgi:hypothetical protein
LNSSADMTAGPAPGPGQAHVAVAAAQPWLKCAALFLVVAVLGLPINDLFHWALLVIAIVLVYAGTVSARPVPWLGAVAVAGLCVLGQMLAPAPRIEEGHNVFLVDRPGGALEAGLPADVFRHMLTEFDARYPPQRRCDPAAIGCWRGQGFPDRPFAFSADGIFGHPAYSRRVTGIDFADPVWLGLGFINEGRYNWNAKVSDVVRDSRDRRFWAFVHRWWIEMPWFVMYRFPAAFAGSELCWRGEVLWEGADQKFSALRHAETACRTLTADDVGRRIFGVAIANDPPLSMRLVPSASIRLRQMLGSALALIGSAAVLGFLLRGRMRRALLPVTLVVLALVVAFLNDASFIGGVRPFDSGDDGLVYDGYARAMLQKMLAGDMTGALRGEESVFYYTPGMRYLRAVEHIFFGESYLGYLTLMLFLPVLVFAVFLRFLPPRWAIALALIFAAVPIGVLFGSSFVLYVKWAARGFADPAAYFFFLTGLLALVGRTADGPDGRFAPAFGAGLMFALALFVRPNLAPGIGVLLGGAGLAALWQSQWRRVAGLCIGFMPMLGMALHNWGYGGVFVLFTSTAAHPGALVMPPSAYLAAFAELLHLDFAGVHLARALRQIGGWLAGPSELLLMAPVNASAVVVLVRVAVWGRVDPWLRLTASATLAQHGVGLFYLTHGRYHYLAWLLTLLVVAVWVHGEGIGWLPRMCPGRSAARARSAK